MPSLAFPIKLYVISVALIDSYSNCSGKLSVNVFSPALADKLPFTITVQVSFPVAGFT